MIYYLINNIYEILKKESDMIILVGSNKGGAGKTTTAITILSGLQREGFEVLGIDADNQKSL